MSSCRIDLSCKQIVDIVRRNLEPRCFEVRRIRIKNKQEKQTFHEYQCERTIVEVFEAGFISQSVGCIITRNF